MQTHTSPLPTSNPRRSLNQPRLRINNTLSPARSLHQVGILLLQDLEIALSFPVPNAVGGEDEIDFFKGALVGFWVQGPDHGDGDDVAGAEYVEGFFAEGGEHYGAEEGLLHECVSHGEEIR